MQNDVDKIELLLKFNRGELTGDAEKAVREALKNDPELRIINQLLQDIQIDTGKGDWSQILNFASESASRMFDDFMRNRREGAEVYAVRTYDSKLTPLAEGVRPAAVDCRRLKFKIGDYDLELSLYPVSTDSREIIGQVHKAKFGKPLEVRLKSGKRSYSVTADRFNLFRFERVPVAEYKMTLLSDGQIIGIVDLSL